MQDNPYQRYYYDGTYVLKNKLDIADGNDLHAFEYEWSASQLPEALAYARSASVLDGSALQGVHRILLGDIYDWAGELRKIPMSKGELEFLHPVTADAVNEVFKAFAQNTAIDRPNRNDVAAQLARLWGDLNYAHPLVESNGRATQLMLTVIAERSDWTIDWASVSKSDETYAGVASCVLDLGDQRFDGFRDILLNALQPNRKPDPHDDLDKGNL